MEDPESFESSSCSIPAMINLTTLSAPNFDKFVCRDGNLRLKIKSIC